MIGQVHITICLDRDVKCTHRGVITPFVGVESGAATVLCGLLASVGGVQSSERVLSPVGTSHVTTMKSEKIVYVRVNLLRYRTNISLHRGLLLYCSGLGQDLHTRLSLLKPVCEDTVAVQQDSQAREHDQHSYDRDFEDGPPVLCK